MERGDYHSKFKKSSPRNEVKTTSIQIPISPKGLKRDLDQLKIIQDSHLHHNKSTHE
jgi:hypothetical protein